MINFQEIEEFYKNYISEKQEEQIDKILAKFNPIWDSLKTDFINGKKIDIEKTILLIRKVANNGDIA